MERREKWILGVKVLGESEEIFKILCFWLNRSDGSRKMTVMIIICNNITNL